MSILTPSRPPTSILSPPQSTTFFPPNSALSSPTREVTVATAALRSYYPAGRYPAAFDPRHPSFHPQPSPSNRPQPADHPATRPATPSSHLHHLPSSLRPIPLDHIAPPSRPTSLSVRPTTPRPVGASLISSMRMSHTTMFPNMRARQPRRRFPPEAQSPPLVADPPQQVRVDADADANYDANARTAARTRPSLRPGISIRTVPRPLSDIPEATQSQEASQVSRLIPHLPPLFTSSPRLSLNLPPPSEHTTEGDEPDYQSGLDSSQYEDAGCASRHPPACLRGSVINDDDSDR
jgi:hypothetical protein